MRELNRSTEVKNGFLKKKKKLRHACVLLIQSHRRNRRESVSLKTPRDRFRRKQTISESEDAKVTTGLSAFVRGLSGYLLLRKSGHR